MDIIGNEVTQRIRAAITNKLKDVGVYVDDELPDYIMVMVANKKSREQMMTDLMLFLGTSTESFTKWLHELLDNLQATTSVEPSTVLAAVKDKDKEEENLFLADPAPALPTVNVEEVPSPFATPIVDEDNEDVLTFQTELETDDILMQELQKEESKVIQIDTTKLYSKIKITPRAVSPEKDTTMVVSKTSAKVRPIFHRRNTPQSTVHRPLKSYKGYFSKNMDEDEEDEKYDPRNPAVGTVASIVRVTERKSSVPKALQANKLLLFKAMDDANKSVNFSQRKPQTVHIEPYEPTPISKLTKPTLKVHSQVVLDEPKISLHEEPEEVEMIVQSEEEETPNIVLENIVLENPKEIRIPVISSKIPLMPLKRKITSEPVPLPENSPSLRNPRFVVTLDGVDPREFMSPKSLRSVVSQKDMDTTEEHVLMADREEEEEEEEDPPYEDQEPEEFYAEEQEMEESEEEPAKRLKVPVRCRKWPACRNGDACKFHHPKQHCKMFPNCTYGRKCLYIHPNCKYDSTCTNEYCPYTHASRRLQPIPQAIPICVTSEIIPVTSTAVCRFHPECLNPNCTFYHPKPCRYGQHCKNASCNFTHPMSSVASPHQLKWTAPKLYENVYVSQYVSKDLTVGEKRNDPFMAIKYPEIFIHNFSGAHVHSYSEVMSEREFMQFKAT